MEVPSGLLTRVSVVRDGGRERGRFEALVPDGRQVDLCHVVLVDVDGRLVLAAARFESVRPVLGPCG